MRDDCGHHDSHKQLGARRKHVRNALYQDTAAYMREVMSTDPQSYPKYNEIKKCALALWAPTNSQPGHGIALDVTPLS